MSDNPTDSDGGETVSSSGGHNAVRELRTVVYVLAGLVFFLSIGVNVFMYKQNSRVSMELSNANTQIQQIESNQTLINNKNAMENLIKEVAGQYPAHPEVQQILAGYGLTIQQAPPAAAATPPVPAVK